MPKRPRQLIRIASEEKQPASFPTLSSFSKFRAKSSLTKLYENGEVESYSLKMAAIRVNAACALTVGLIRSYMGKIRLAAFKDEPARFVPGLHEPLISESLFYKVQDIIDGRKRQMGQIVYVPEMLPLRGFLRCPKCTRILTGSASKGRTNYFYYYHCSSACGIRYRADMLNDLFVAELQKYKLKRPMGTIYSRVVHDEFHNMARHVLEKRRQLVSTITEQHNRLSKARAHALLDDFDPDDYRILKKDCEDKIFRLEADLRELSKQPEIKVNLDELLEKAVYTFENLDSIYEKADIVKKRDIIGSMFPEKLCFDGTKHRTGKINEAIALSHLINSELKGKKNGAKSMKFDLPHEGSVIGLEPLYIGFIKNSTNLRPLWYLISNQGIFVAVVLNESSSIKGAIAFTSGRKVTNVPVWYC